MKEALPSLSEEHFAMMTAYCQATDLPEANIQRAKLLGILADDVRLAPGAIVRLQGKGSIGRRCFVGLYSYLNGEVILEEDVIVGPYCSITSNTHIFDPTTAAFSKSEHDPIRIGRGTWLCAGAMVTAGVAVGIANLICANAVVTKDTEDFSIMAGTPARRVGWIDSATGAYHWHGK